MGAVTVIKSQLCQEAQGCHKSQNFPPPNPCWSNRKKVMVGKFSVLPVAGTDEPFAFTYGRAKCAL